MPQISVIVPVYNSARYLRECLNSVLAQTFTDWEVIAVDDGSTDGSGGILDEYAKADSRFHITHKQNEGVSAARNDALGLVSGQWVTFLDSDDLLAPDWMEQATHGMHDGVDLIHQRYCCGENTPPNNFGESNDCVFRYLDGREAAIWTWRVLSHKGFIWLCFFRREIALSRNFRLNLDYKEDSIWLTEISPLIRKVCENSFCGYFYRITPKSLSRRGKRTIECVTYLNVLCDIWQNQREWRMEYGLDAIVSGEIHICADEDVIEWITTHNDIKMISNDTVKNVRKAYFKLVKSMEHFDKCKVRARYFLGFWFWRKFGCHWPLKGTEVIIRNVRSLRTLVGISFKFGNHKSRGLK